MVQIQGEERFERDLRSIVDALGDLALLSRAIPGLERVDSIDATTLQCRVRPSLSFLSGSLKTTVIRQEVPGPDTVSYRIHSKGIGAGATVATRFECAEDRPGTTLVKWNASIEELIGLLKPVPSTLVESAMTNVISSTWAGVRTQLQATA